MNNTEDFTFHGQGTLKRIDTFVSKAGKSILTLIFEIQGQYPQLIPIKVFGRLAEQAADWKPGAVLSVTGRLGGRAVLPPRSHRRLVGRPSGTATHIGEAR